MFLLFVHKVHCFINRIQFLSFVLLFQYEIKMKEKKVKSKKNQFILICLKHDKFWIHIIFVVKQSK